MTTQTTTCLATGSSMAAPTVIGYVVDMRGIGQRWPFANARCVIALPHEIAETGPDGRPSRYASYRATYHGPYVTIAEAAQQPWPVWYATNVWRNGRMRHAMRLSDVDVVVEQKPVVPFAHRVRRGQCSDYCAWSRAHPTPHSIPGNTTGFLTGACAACGACLIDVCDICHGNVLVGGMAS